jgi:hypothetical protein
MKDLGNNGGATETEGQVDPRKDVMSHHSNKVINAYAYHTSGEGTTPQSP